MRFFRTRYRKKRDDSLPAPEELTGGHPELPKLKVHREEINRRDRGHAGPVPRVETVEASMAKRDHLEADDDDSVSATRRTKRRPMMRKVARKSAIQMELMKRNMPHLTWRSFRPRRPSRERMLILATLTGAAAVFLLMVLQMAQSHPHGLEPEAVTPQDDLPIVETKETKEVEADVDAVRIARIDDMSKPVPNPPADADDMTFLEEMGKLQKRPFLKRDQDEPEAPQAFTRTAEPEETQQPARETVSITPPQDIAQTSPPPTESVDIPPKQELADDELLEPKIQAPEIKPIEPAQAADDPFGDPPAIVKTEEPPPRQEPAATEPVPSSDDPFGDPPAVVKTEEPPPKQEVVAPDPVPETVDPFAASTPEPTPTPSHDPTPEPVVPEPEPPVTTQVPVIADDVDIDVKVERVPSPERRDDSDDDESNRFLVKSDANPKTPSNAIDNQSLDSREGWARADSNSKSTLITPNFQRQKQPTWRLVAPLATSGDPNEIESADSENKELNIVIRKTAPRESSSQQMLSYEIIVRNESEHRVDGLIIEEQVPETLRVADVVPKAQSFENQTLTWHLESFGAHEERKLEVNLFAVEDGAVESRTIARPFAAVQSKTQVDAAKLRLEASGSYQVASGRVCPLVFRVTNDSDAPVEDIVLHADLPDEFSHDKGRSLEFPIDRLDPGESRTARLHPRARYTGTAVTPAALLVGESQVAEANVSVQVVDKGSASSSAKPARRKSAPCPCDCVPCCP